MDVLARRSPKGTLEGKAKTATRVLALGLAAFILFSVFQDYYLKGLGANNMRVVSFVDSLWHCYCFRARQVNYFTAEEVTSPDKAPRRLRAGSTFVYTSTRKDVLTSAGILLRAFFIKFMGGTVVSLAFGQTPVWLKGFRHIASFLVALTIIQGLPSFAVPQGVFVASYRASSLLVETIRASTTLRAAIRFSGALYKMRKLGFLVAACISSRLPWGVLVALAVWVIECSAVMMSVDAKIEGHHPWLPAVTSTLLSSRWRVSACASLCLVVECIVRGPDEFLQPSLWLWVSPFKVAAFALLVVRNFGGFTQVDGYPVISAVATQCYCTDDSSTSVSPSSSPTHSLRRMQPVKVNQPTATSDSDGGPTLFPHKEEKGETVAAAVGGIRKRSVHTTEGDLLEAADESTAVGMASETQDTGAKERPDVTTRLAQRRPKND
eukprot:INCI17379.1.p1 GENE.INCI17379.1~~INCI17379.1.p1  ORF type:complete len:436 (+),score=54.74 INCI17379.1:140-1447(+)